MLRHPFFKSGHIVLFSDLIEGRRLKRSIPIGKKRILRLSGTGGLYKPSGDEDNMGVVITSFPFNLFTITLLRKFLSDILRNLVTNSNILFVC